MLDLDVPLAGLGIPACGLNPVIELDVLVTMVLVAGVLDVLLDLVTSRVEILPVGLELESVCITAGSVRPFRLQAREPFATDR